MTKADRETIQQLVDGQKQILGLLRGDEFGRKGLVQQQQEDEDFKVTVQSDLKTILHNQDAQMRINADIESRMKNVESFILIFQKLSKIKKSTLIWILAIGGLISTLLVKLESFLHSLNIHIRP